MTVVKNGQKRWRIIGNNEKSVKKWQIAKTYGKPLKIAQKLENKC